MSNKGTKRDASIELARIIGCMIVIGVHTALPARAADSWDVSRTVIAMFLADGVAVFWMISGAFIFSASSYAALWRRSAKAIAGPLILFSVFVFYCRDFLLREASLFESLAHTKEEYLGVLGKLLTLRNPIDGCVQLWYLYVYLLVILAFPMFAGLVRFLDQDAKRDRFYVCLIMLLLVLNDAAGNKVFGFSHYSINGMLPAGLEMTLGHILYKHKNIIRRHHAPIAAAVFVCMNLLRTFIQIRWTASGREGNAIMYWYSSIGLVCAAAVIVFCCAIFSKNDDRGGCRFVRSLASYTFTIYLFHVLIRDMLSKAGFQDFLKGTLCVRFQGFTGELLYALVMISVVFTISLIIAVVLRFLIQCIRRLHRQ